MNLIKKGYKMKRDIILIALLLIAAVAVSGCINGPMDNVNDRLKTVNTDITEGDTDYNAALNAISSRDFSTADSNIQTARDKFTDAEDKFKEIENYESDLNESVYTDYLSIAKEEVSLKKEASDGLYLAVQYYISGDSSSGNSYTNAANSVMKQAVTLQNQRNAIVEENPDLFKKAGII